MPTESKVLSPKLLFSLPQHIIDNIQNKPQNLSNNQYSFSSGRLPNFDIKEALQLLYAGTSGTGDLIQKELLLKQRILKNSWVLTYIPYSDSGYELLSKESLLMQRKICVPLYTRINSVF